MAVRPSATARHVQSHRTEIRCNVCARRYRHHLNQHLNQHPKQHDIHRLLQICSSNPNDRDVASAEEATSRGERAREQNRGAVNDTRGLGKSGDWKQERGEWNSTPSSSTAALPNAMDGVNWYCYTVLGLLFLADFTPIGASLQDSSTAVVTLAAVQWLLFVLPTIWFVKTKEWDLRRTFKLEPCQPSWVIGGLLAGSALFLVVSFAISIKSGTPFLQAGIDPAAQPSLVGDLLSRPNSAADWVGVFALVGVSPAVAEELLFRGFLLTSIQQRLGSIDAVSVCAALFALIHLSIPQFFNFAVLGAACGLMCTRSGSVLSAMSLHLGYNVTGLLLGVILHS